MQFNSHRVKAVVLAFVVVCFSLAPRAVGQNVTYKPYIQPGDNGPFGPSDQMVIAWQTDEASPNPDEFTVQFGESPSYGRSVAPQVRIVDNYLSADASLPVPPTSSGPHSNYSAVLKGLEYNTTYFYLVTGPGLPSGGFAAHFHTRKRGDDFSFLVQGDEGFFPAEANSNPPRLADFEARIIHLMYNVHHLEVPGVPHLPKPDLALNTGDNVYTNGAEGSYRDFWFPVWNSDVDSNETGAPFIRSIPFYIVVGNHDIGATGVNVNMLGGDGAGRFSGNTDGGDAMAYFNNYYYPLNGPAGVDAQFTWNADTVIPNGMIFSFKGKSYTSPAAIAAYRSSTAVDAGKGPKQQIDHMHNYSLDSGSAHFVFLDANPHLFNGQLDGTALYAKAPQAFSAYPSVLRDWLINDLDSSCQPWKVVVFHQPAFSSGNATVRNSQMRTVAKFLEDHGVNMVFNGHEHNYQRTYPLRSLNAAAAPVTTGGPAVSIDTTFDRIEHTVPDGVLYLVEGAGGNRDFDGDLASPRGQGPGIDQDDSASGTATVAGFTFLNGPASWLDTDLTSAAFSPVQPGAGSGEKITAKFKAKVFSFADVVVRDNKLTLYQITEPLTSSSSATASNPAPFGTDVNGNPMNDPIPDTLVDPATGSVVTPPATGASALLDKFTVTKPDLGDRLHVKLWAPHSIAPGGQLIYTLSVHNGSVHGLNGTQAVFEIPSDVTFVSSPDGLATQVGDKVVVTIGRLDAGGDAIVHLQTQVSANAWSELRAKALLRSSTALSALSNEVHTRVGNSDDGNSE
ncbi:MAG TPA: metallophosphoesterase family protein [Candidatus Acidoferrum sp.]